MNVVQLHILFLFLASCSSAKFNNTQEVPSWVKSFRSGIQTVKVNQTDRILYRANIISSEEEKPESTCDKSIKKAMSYIKSEFPFLEKFPYTVEYVYYDSQVRDCSTTLSISSSFAKKMIELNQYKKNINKVSEQLNQDLIKQKEANEDLKNQVMQLTTYIEQNKHLLEKVDNLKSITSKIQSRINSEDEVIMKHFISGMSVDEVTTLLGKEIDISYEPSSSHCRNGMGGYRSVVGSLFELCWSGARYNKPVIVGWCKSGKCWN
jgi:hypothetical protein